MHQAKSGELRKTLAANYRDRWNVSAQGSPLYSRGLKLLSEVDHVGNCSGYLTIHGNWNSGPQWWNEAHHQSCCLCKTILISWYSTIVALSIWNINNIKNIILKAIFPGYQAHQEICKDWATRPAVLTFSQKSTASLGIN